MYEYKCANEECNQTWTIREGEIGTLYLTCPFCKKGRGSFLRQVKSEFMHEDMEKLALRKPNEYPEIIPDVPVVEDTVIEETTVPKKQESVPEVEVEKPKRERKKREKPEIKVKVNVSEPEAEQLEIEENIFERIKKKRQQEEEFTKDIGEETDVLEISGDTLEEIDNRIKEFEEYYYIKVLDKNIQQQGKRYNCIIKYCRR